MSDRIEELKRKIELKKTRILEAQNHAKVEKTESEEIKINIEFKSKCINEAFQESLTTVKEVATESYEEVLTYENLVCREVMAIYDGQNPSEFLRLSQIISNEIEKEIASKFTDIKKIKILQKWFSEEFEHEQAAKASRLEAIEQAQLRKAKRNNIVQFTSANGYGFDGAPPSA